MPDPNATTAPGGPVLTPTQARTAQAIVNIFETGAVPGRYDQVTLLPGDSGRLTYGRSQTTLGSGNLHALLQRYCSDHGARFGTRLANWLPALARKDAALDADRVLHNLLRACADDPVMRETQDAFFDHAYWQPALRAATRLGLRTPLGVAVAYDGHVHGSWMRIRDRANALGAPHAIGEPTWLQAYVSERRAWLATHRIPILRATVYRMDAFQGLIDQGRWGLELPLVVRGAEISIDTLNGLPSSCYDGPQPGSRALAVQNPLLRGLDVRLVQLALSEAGAVLGVDGVYGGATARCVREWQIARGVAGTGVLDRIEVLGVVG
jgi:chitosanase